MNTTNRKPGQWAGIDYAALTPAQLAMPRAELASLLGVTRNALWRGIKTAGFRKEQGRPSNRIPGEVTGLSKAADIAERHGVSIPTARKWIRLRREGAGA